MVDRFAVAGTPEYCRKRLAELARDIDEIKLTLVPFRIDETEAAARVVEAVRAASGATATVHQQ